MTKIISAIIFLFLVAFLLASGCTTGPTTPVLKSDLNQSPGVIQTTGPAGHGNVEQTQVLPPQYYLDFQVKGNNDANTPKISVYLTGGNGTKVDTKVDINLTRPDGMVIQKSMEPIPLCGELICGAFPKGQVLEFPTNLSQNRVEIWVTAPEVGRVKVYDDVIMIK
jgi:hypothetical protein